MNTYNFIKEANKYGKKKKPFIFIIDFEMKKPIISLLENAEKNGIIFDVKGRSNIKSNDTHTLSKIEIKQYKLDYNRYKTAFSYVINEINKGNSYLINLTFPTKIMLNITPEEIFHISKAPYKLLVKNKFVLFSPECFIRTDNNYIFSYPMKGTIDASISNAQETILKNKKEYYEHNTIVDLIRNDLAIISKNITVTKFRYVEKIKTNHNELLQVSSEIKGELPENWNENIGDILFKLLPAGSISGAPKQKTVDIIKIAEKEQRGYYTGIFGIFDGKNIDSAVNIRYIDTENNNYKFRSGGGITSMSNINEEYQELSDKIYVPIT